MGSRKLGRLVLPDTYLFPRQERRPRPVELIRLASGVLPFGSAWHASRHASMVTTGVSGGMRHDFTSHPLLATSSLSFSNSALDISLPGRASETSGSFAAARFPLVAAPDLQRTIRTTIYLATIASLTDNDLSATTPAKK
jgi:hypothetical protein